MDNNLVLKNVYKDFKRVDKDEVTSAIKDINFTVHSGEFVSLVGTSGCGKSTILRLVAGLIEATSGEILVDGKNISGPSVERGMVFQKPTLFPWLTVRQNIEFSFNISGKIAENREKVNEILEKIGLKDFENDYPNHLSGGMAQRVALARTLVCEPKILLLDEPLSALDAFTRMNMQDEILKLWQNNRCLVLMVTHDVEEAVYMGTKVIVMEPHPGRINEIIPIDMEYKRERNSKKFIEYRNRILTLLNYG